MCWPSRISRSWRARPRGKQHALLCSNSDCSTVSFSFVSLPLSLSLLVTPARIFRLWYAMHWWSRCARYKPLHTSNASLDRIPQIRRRLWMICWFPARRAMLVPLKWTGWMCPATSYSNHLWLWWVEPGGDPSCVFLQQIYIPPSLLTARYAQVIVTHETHCQRGWLDQAAQIHRGLWTGGLNQLETLPPSVIDPATVQLILLVAYCIKSSTHTLSGSVDLQHIPYTIHSIPYIRINLYNTSLFCFVSNSTTFCFLFCCTLCLTLCPAAIV